MEVRGPSLKDPKPLQHEIAFVWITGDGKRYLNEDEAIRNQHRYERALALERE